MKAIGLDIGTTAICGILADIESGEVLRVESRKNGAFLEGKPFERLQDALLIEEKVNDIMNALYTDDICVVGVTGQMHGIVYTDREGRAVSPLYTWQDKRGDEPYLSSTYAESLSSHSGYGNVTNFYNRINSLVPESAHRFCTVHDYAVMSLTGRKEPLVHISNAASFGNFDAGRQAFTLEDELLPEVTADLAIAGEWRGIPVAVAIGDNQASFIGCGGTKGDVLVNIGTGAQVSSVWTGGDCPCGMEIRPLDKTHDIVVGSSLCGGRAFAMLEGFFGAVLEMSGCERRSLYDAMERSASSKKGSEMIFETLFCGTRSEPDRRASIARISADNFTPGDMVYACLSGIAEELYLLYRRCPDGTRLIASGNCVRRTWLLQEILEERFGMKIHIPKYEEEASFGALLFASAAAGAFESLEEAERIIKYE